MAAAINVIDRHGFSNEMHDQLLPRRLDKAVLALNITEKDVLFAIHYKQDKAH